MLSRLSHARHLLPYRQLLTITNATPTYTIAERCIKTTPTKKNLNPQKGDTTNKAAPPRHTKLEDTKTKTKTTKNTTKEQDTTQKKDSTTKETTTKKKSAAKEKDIEKNDSSSTKQNEQPTSTSTNGTNNNLDSTTLEQPTTPTSNVKYSTQEKGDSQQNNVEEEKGDVNQWKKPTKKNSEIDSVVSEYIRVMKDPSTTHEMAVKAFSNLPRNLKDVGSYNEYLSFLVKRKSAQEIMTVLKEMRERDIAFNIRTFTLNMAHLGTKGNAQEASRMVDLAQRSGVKVTEDLFASFIQYAIEAGHVVQAMQVVSDMPKYGVSPLHLHSSIARVASSLDTKKMMQVCSDLESLRDLDENQAIVLAILYSRFGNVVACLKLYEKFKRAKHTPQVLLLFTEILACLQKAHAYTQFWSTLGNMREFKVPFDLDSLNRIMLSLARMRDPNEKKLEEIYNEIKDKKFTPNVETYEAFIAGLSRINIKHARLRYHQMVRESHKPTPAIIHHLIKGYCDAAMLGECVEFLHVLRRASLTPIDFNDLHLILSAMLDVSDHLQATHLLEFYSREDKWLDIACCNKLAALFAKTKQTEKLLQLLATMEKREVTPDINFYTTLVIFHVHEGKLLDGIAVLKKMMEAQMQLPADTWRPLVARLIKDGYKEDAKKVIEIAAMSGADVSVTRKYLEKLT